MEGRKLCFAHKSFLVISYWHRMYFEGEKVLINDANDLKANFVGYSKFFKGRLEGKSEKEKNNHVIVSESREGINLSHE